MIFKKQFNSLMNCLKRRVKWFVKPISQWLVELLPYAFDQVFRFLSNNQLLLLIVCGLLLLTPLITLRQAIWQQGLVAGLLIAVAYIAQQIEEQDNSKKTSEYVHLFLVILSILTTVRYLYYRTSYTLNLEDWLNGTLSLLLIFAEIYSITVLFLTYFQTLKIKDRKPVDLADFPKNQWLTVDIYIPTYNESVELVRKTVLAAIAIDYPADKKKVYVLDDGGAEQYKARRAQLRRMCEELGVTMMTRDNNDHAKAGNINTAFKRTDGELVLILDCDHIPTRNFLQETVGFFLRDEKLAFVQTPHWSYNPDPFERNLHTRGKIPVVNELFYKVLQKGNDFWNATILCGSAVLLRKEYVLQVGGMATETLTEDCHTGLRLHSLGYKSIYYDKILAAGLAPTRFSSYVKQQVRWARGTAQVLRLENPLFNPKLNLTIPQRLCYFGATSYFFYGYSRLMYVLTPALFLLFAISPIKHLGLETLFYFIPHIWLSQQTNHICFKHVRFSFWNQIFELALSFQAGIVTLLAMVNPKLGSFQVTDKELTPVTERYFDFDSVRYLVILSAITAVSLLTVPFWLWFSPEDAQTVLMQIFWCTFNLFMLLAICFVAFEQPQLRRTHRLPRKLTAVIHSGNQSWIGQTVDVSESGTQIILDEWPNIADEIKLELEGDYGALALLNGRVIRATATSKHQARLFINFINLTSFQKDDLNLVIYSDVKEWSSQTRTEVNDPLESFKFIMTASKRVFREFQPAITQKMGIKSTVRKRVEAVAQLYPDGWESGSIRAKLTEIGTQDLRLELDGRQILHLETMLQTQPIIGLLISQDTNDSQPQYLLAQFEIIEELAIYYPPKLDNSQRSANINPVAMELSFPESLKLKQHDKIQLLLQSLN
ncbi:MAG: glycosyltransferase [Symploca sp. SIO3E6]|nr:glycosyltransferase [Caldora sp. SIO3E6]